MYLSLFPLFTLTVGMTHSYQTHGLCSVELFRAPNPFYTNLRLGEFEAWWVSTVGPKGLRGPDSMSVLLGYYR